MKKICAVLVTFNRKKLLESVLNDLKIETYPVNGIVLVNNHSTDGTEEMLEELGVIKKCQTDNMLSESTWFGIKIFYYRNGTNEGGSGGFAKAFEIAEKLDYDYIWAMDDDVSPEKDCLEKLLNALDDEHKSAIPCRTDENWQDYAIVNYDLSNPFNRNHLKTNIRSQDLTSDPDIIDFPLEGPLIDMQIARKVGIPDKEYFIMYDDTDFAHRICQYTKIRYVVEARLHRKLAKAQCKDANTFSWKDYYITRNRFVFDKRYGKNFFVRNFRPWLFKTSRICGACIKKNSKIIPMMKRAYYDAIHHNMGKTVEPGTDISAW